MPWQGQELEKVAGTRLSWVTFSVLESSHAQTNPPYPSNLNAENEAVRFARFPWNFFSRRKMSSKGSGNCLPLFREFKWHPFSYQKRTTRAFPRHDPKKCASNPAFRAECGSFDPLFWFGSRIAIVGANFILPMASAIMTRTAKRQANLVLSVDARVQRAIARIAESDCPILILGEDGAGKRSAALRIHVQSNRSRGAFKEIHCASANAQLLLETFSGSGTVYLAEITDLSLPLQGFIIDSYFRAEQMPSCRLLCGSSRELQEEVKAWRMREDFYYLVSAMTLRIPPLRCRKPEILSLADELLTQYARQFDRPKPILCKEVVEYLMEHAWHGNLPELETAIKTIVAVGDPAIALAAIKTASPPGKSNGNHRHLLLKEATRASSLQIERQLITEVLITTGGNRKRAAADLGISYKALLNKLKQIETENHFVFCKNGVAR
jgi:hypothetical protein